MSSLFSTNGTVVIIDLDDVIAPGDAAFTARFY